MGGVCVCVCVHMLECTSQSIQNDKCDSDSLGSILALLLSCETLGKLFNLSVS